MILVFSKWDPDKHGLHRSINFFCCIKYQHMKIRVNLCESASYFKSYYP